jgi:hypothetical protein
MKFSLLNESDRMDLLNQRVLQHERAYFDLQVQRDEIDALLPTLKEEEADKARDVRRRIVSQMDEIETRVKVVRKMRDVYMNGSAPTVHELAGVPQG